MHITSISLSLYLSNYLLILIYLYHLCSGRPLNGWSQITIPDKLSLISDAGKLFVLDGLLTRLKEGGHRVLIYTQVNGLFIAERGVRKRVRQTDRQTDGV